MSIRRPLLGLTVASLAATAGGLYMPLPAPPLLFAAGIALLLTLPCWRRPVALVPLLAAWMLLAWAHASQSVQPPSPLALENRAGRPKEYLELTGLIGPDLAILPREEEAFVTAQFTLLVEALERSGVRGPAQGAAATRITLPAGTDIAPGQRWRILGLLERTPGRAGAGWRYRLTPDRQAAARLPGGGLPWLMQKSLEGRDACSRRLEAGLVDYPRETGLLKALLLGYRSFLAPDLRNIFSITGTLHIFAISGSHVVVLGALLLGVIQFCGVPRRLYVLLLGPALGFYVLATGLQASAIRACLMALCLWSATLFVRQPDAATGLAVAALLIVIWQPLQLVDPGFVLSFVVVGGLMLLYPVFSGAFRPPEAQDSFLAARPPAWKRLLLWGRREAIALLAASAAAWLSSAPLTAYYFNVFSPVALLANLVVIPAASLVMLTGSLTLTLGSLSGGLGTVLNHANLFFVQAMLWATDQLARVPSGWFNVETPPVLLLFAWYACLLVGWLVWPRLRGILLFMLPAVLLWCGWSGRTQPAVTWEIPAEGRYQTILIHRNGSHSLMLNAGPHQAYPALLRGLRARGLDCIDALFLTSPLARFSSGASNLLAGFQVLDIRLPGPAHDRRFAAATSAVERAAVHPVRAGDTGQWHEVVGWQILWTPTGAVRSASDAALFTGWDCAGVKILVCPAADLPAAATNWPPADVLVLGQPGRPAPGLSNLLRRVRPAAVIFLPENSSRVTWEPDPGLLALIRARTLVLWNPEQDGGLRLDVWPAEGTNRPTWKITPSETR